MCPSSLTVPALIGAVLHTLNIRLFAEQVAYIINHAEDKVTLSDLCWSYFSKLIFVDQDLRSLLEPLHAAGKIPTVKQFVLMGHVRSTTTLRPFKYYEDLIKAASPVIAFREDLNENAGLGLCYTSGTCAICAASPPLTERRHHWAPEGCTLLTPLGRARIARHHHHRHVCCFRARSPPPCSAYVSWCVLEAPDSN